VSVLPYAVTKRPQLELLLRAVSTPGTQRDVLLAVCDGVMRLNKGEAA
jgi:hypothetical protein